jgi:Restriction endonuclease
VDWKQYEQEIEHHFRTEYPTATITADAKLPGKLSKIDRQIDLLIEAQICDMRFRIIIDAKHYNRKIDVKDVEEFLSMVRDVGAHKALMISPEGYTNAAMERAHADDADVVLDVLNFKELQFMTGLSGIPYAGPHGAVVLPPLGWVIDATKRVGTLAYLYERGLTFQEATAAHEFMYINFWNKNDKEMPDLDSVLKYQESYMLHYVDTVEFIEGVHRPDAKTLIRVARLKYPNPNASECTGFVDFEGFIFMCVLFSPNVVADKNLSKLRFVLRNVFAMTVVHSTVAPQQEKS